ncbi:MAG: hypothetical protein D3904_13865 [Candidatus Electrothrix sp. EH2]|nr:hypothetical protein [Candidatus Electrothrix sp. EH2]
MAFFLKLVLFYNVFSSIYDDQLSIYLRPSIRHPTPCGSAEHISTSFLISPEILFAFLKIRQAGIRLIDNSLPGKKSILSRWKILSTLFRRELCLK